MMKLLTDYTREELASLPAGAELDALLWEITHPAMATCSLPAGAIVPISGRLQPVTPPCSSWSAGLAITALETYRYHGMIDCWTTSSPRTGSSPALFTVSLWRAQTRLLSWDAETLPVTICRALVLHAWDQAQPHESTEQPLVQRDVMPAVQKAHRPYRSPEDTRHWWEPLVESLKGTRIRMLLQIRALAAIRETQRARRLARTK